MSETHAQIAKRREVLAAIRNILIANLKVRREPDEIDPDTAIFGSGLGLDSVDAVELLVSLESQLGVRPPDEGNTRVAMRTVGTLVDLVLEIRAAEIEAP